MDVLPREVDPTRVFSLAEGTPVALVYTPLVLMIQTESWNDNVSAEARLYTAIEMHFDFGMWGHAA